MSETSTPAQRAVLLKHAEMILRASETSVPDVLDRADVRRRYDAVAGRERAASVADGPPSTV